MARKSLKEMKYIVAIVLMVCITLATIVGLELYIEKSVHNERTNYLTTQTESTAGLINNIINQNLEYARISENIIDNQLVDGKNIDELIKNINDALTLGNTRLLLVDSNCTWYGENGTTGRITSTEHFISDTPDELIYMTTGVDASVESICYRIRLHNPVKLETQKGSVTIEYINLIYYMNYMSQDLMQSFPYNCNSFIVDNTGLMIYKEFRMGILISGSNIYSKFERANFINGDDALESLNSMKQRKITVAEMKIKQNRYFICSAPLDINNWSLCFVIDNNELAAGKYITTVFIYILILGFIFALATIIASVLFFRNRDNRMLIEKNQKANELLEQASNAKSEFISNISHDIRTPINGIMGMTAIAMEDAISEKTKDCLGKIDVSARYLLSLVNDVLDISELETNGVQLNSKPTDFFKLLSDCMVIIGSKTLGRDLSIETDFKEVEGKWVLVDELRLKQVIINILGNAVKFTPDGGTISFNIASTNDGTYYFDIKDTGIGMSEDFVEHIWDRFTQSEAGSRSEYKGSGLGMAITKTIVMSMGGDINVESALGEGSRFVVSLPLEECNPEQADGSATSKTADLSRIKVLIAEDNEINMEIAVEVLSSKGAVAVPAENGRIAYEKFLNNPAGTYDVVLMDIMMPEMNGIECTKAIRSSDREDAKSIPIIAMTANTDESVVAQTREAGMNSLIAKPVDINVLYKEISKFVGE